MQFLSHFHSEEASAIFKSTDLSHVDDLSILENF